MHSADEIYRFVDPIEFLNFTFATKQFKNNRFSLRAWSRQLGYENPSALWQILKRERKLKMDVAVRITANLKLPEQAKQYFELLVLLQNSKTINEKHLYGELIESLRPKIKPQPHNLTLEAFRVISDWYHTAILELVGLKDFVDDIPFIFQRLGREISQTNIQKAIDRLLKLELLRRDTFGKLSRPAEGHLILENFLPNEAIRYFHKSMLDKAKVAIDTQQVNEREIRGSMLSLKSKDYEKVIEIIKRAHEEVLKYSCDGNGDEVYQLNTQFFKITQDQKEVPS